MNEENAIPVNLLEEDDLPCPAKLRKLDFSESKDDDLHADEDTDNVVNVVNIIDDCKSDDASGSGDSMEIARNMSSLNDKSSFESLPVLDSEIFGAVDSEDSTCMEADKGFCNSAIDDSLVKPSSLDALPALSSPPNSEAEAAAGVSYNELVERLESIAERKIVGRAEAMGETSAVATKCCGGKEYILQRSNIELQNSLRNLLDSPSLDLSSCSKTFFKGDCHSGVQSTHSSESHDCSPCSSTVDVCETQMPGSEQGDGIFVTAALPGTFTHPHSMDVGSGVHVCTHNHYNGTPHPSVTGRAPVPPYRPNHNCGLQVMEASSALSHATLSKSSGGSMGRPNVLYKLTPCSTPKPMQTLNYSLGTTPSNLSLSTLTLSSSGSEEGITPPCYAQPVPHPPYNTPTGGPVATSTPLAPTMLEIQAALLQAKNEPLDPIDLNIGRQQHNAKERARRSAQMNRARIKSACDHMRELVPGMGDKTDKATVFEFAAEYIGFLRQLVGNRYDKEFLKQASEGGFDSEMV